MNQRQGNVQRLRNVQFTYLSNILGQLGSNQMAFSVFRG